LSQTLAGTSLREKHFFVGGNWTNTQKVGTIAGIENNLVWRDGLAETSK
jgi:hypothetical protein